MANLAFAASRSLNRACDADAVAQTAGCDASQRPDRPIADGVFGMEVWTSQAAALLWRNALAVVPLAVAVGAFCRLTRLRPATRHTLWLVVLFWFLVPVGLPVFDVAAALRYTPRPIDAPPLGATAIAPIRDPAIGALDRSTSRSIPEHDGDAIAPLLADDALASLPTMPPGNPPPTAAESQLTPLRLLTTVPPRIADTRGLGIVLPDSGAVCVAGQFSPHAERFYASSAATTSHTSESPLVPGRDSCTSASQPTHARLRFATSPQAALHNADVTGLPAFVPLELAAVPDVDAAVTPMSPFNNSAHGIAPIPAAPPSLLVSLARRADFAWSRCRALAIDGSVAFQVLRDDLGRLPAPPAAFWIGSVIGLVLFAAARSSAFQRRMERGRPADAHIVRVVRRVARAVGLRRVPDTWVVSDRLSPMIWCGRRARLVIPEPLWRELDEVSRTAIVAHELAHLRRGDHWVVRLLLIVATAFWWHPVLWWTRRRLDDEADLACDAWVTWLMPRHRRQYAEALLRTRAFLSHQHLGVPPAGMGVASGRAAELARRIKMVMTQSVRPRASLRSLTLAAAVAAFGWIATPAWSVPGGGNDAAAAFVASAGLGHSATPAPGSEHVFQPSAPYAISRQSHVAVVLPGGDTAESAADRGHATAPSAVTQPLTAHDRPTDLRARVDRLERELAELRAAMKGQRPSPDRVTAQRGDERNRGPAPVRSPAAPSTPAALRSPTIPPVTPTLLEQFIARQSTPTPPGAPPHPGSTAPPTFPAAGGETLVRTYKLPPRKLEALYNLMVDNDVPIPVRKLNDAIEVHADRRGQAIVAAYLKLIHPEADFDLEFTHVGDVNHYGVSETLSDLRTIAKPLDADDAAMSQLYKYLMRGCAGEFAQGLETVQDFLLYTHAPRSAADLTRLSAEYEHQVASQFAEGSRAQVEYLAAQLGILERKSAEMESQAVELSRQAELLASGNDSGARRLQLEQRAAALEAQARSLEQYAAMLEQQMRELDRASREFERRANELRDQVETDHDNEPLEDDPTDLYDVESPDLERDTPSLFDEIEEIESGKIERPATDRLP